MRIELERLDQLGLGASTDGAGHDLAVLEQRISVGIDCTPNAEASSGWASTSTLPTFSRPA